ncbi:hypothetical protein BHM03_00046980 [Ensete ventricosum]|nr:hypothetical protein BHM03_00046980 [Ensete ventricosum]
MCPAVTFMLPNPSTSCHLSPSLRRRSRPCEGGGCPTLSIVALLRGSLRPVPLPLLTVTPCGLAASDRPLRAAATPTGGRLWVVVSMGDHLRVSNRPLAGSLGRSQLPLQPAWPWVAAPARGLAMVSHPYKGSSYGWPPLHASFTARMQ